MAASKRILSKRILREKKTIGVMIAMHCASRHGKRVEDCESCGRLLSYAQRKIDNCVFHGSKPACNECMVHRELREEMRAVMRFSGPRMFLHHPLLGGLHFVDRLGHSGGTSAGTHQP